MNPWKKAFIGLAVCVGCFILFISFLFFTSLKRPEEIEKNTSVNAEGVEMEMVFTNKELENLLNLQLEKQSAPVRIQIEDLVILKGTVPILSYELPFEIQAEALSEEEGRIRLDIQQIKGESIRFPRGIVLAALSRVIDQSFLLIQADQNRILIDPSRFADGFSLSAEDINLKENRIVFKTRIDEKYLIQGNE